MNIIIKRILELNLQGIYVEFQDTNHPDLIRLCFSKMDKGLKRMPLEINVSEISRLRFEFDNALVMAINLAVQKLNAG